MLNTNPVVHYVVNASTINGLVRANLCPEYDVNVAERENNEPNLAINVPAEPLTQAELDDVATWANGEYDSPPAFDVIVRALAEYFQVMSGPYLIVFGV